MGTRRLQRRSVFLVCLGMVLTLLSSCSSGGSEKVMLADFEHDAELDMLQWSCRTLYALSDEHVTHGKKALKMELYPSDYPGLVFTPPVRDWRNYRLFAFDVFNPQAEPLSLTVRMDDSRHYPPYGDRLNKRFTLRPGLNHIVLPFAELTTSGTNRPLEMKNIERVFIFAVGPKTKQVFFVDAVQLQ